MAVSVAVGTRLASDGRAGRDTGMSILFSLALPRCLHKIILSNYRSTCFGNDADETDPILRYCDSATLPPTLSFVLARPLVPRSYRH